MRDNYTIKEVAAALNTSTTTLARWEKADEIPRIYRKTTNGYRVYTLQDIEQIADIKGKIVNYERLGII